ncbi:MAG: type II toxin-antitoxin system VapB family antitoxin [Mobilicoccus sp.]|nr:type II toxin-antitoxin system VapB family antitoxin [Mobilicoccus sp.]
MRTTVAIDDELLERARQRARMSGRTLGQVFEDALRRDLASPPAATAPSVPVFHGGGGLVPGVDLTSNRIMAEILDEGVDVDRLR